MSKRPRHQQLDFDDGKGATQVLKIAGVALGSVLFLGVAFGGFVMLKSRKTVDMANLPSAQGLAVQIATKGKVNAREFDDQWSRACETMGSFEREDETSSQMVQRKRAVADCKARR